MNISDSRRAYYGPYLFNLEHDDSISAENIDEFIENIEKPREGFIETTHIRNSFNLKIEYSPDLELNHSGYEFLEFPLGIGKVGMYLKEESNGVEFLMQGFLCRYNFEEKRGEVKIPVNSDIYNYLEGCIRSLTSRLVIQDGGLLLHCACVAYGGNAIVFPGGQDSGKTTLCEIMESEFTIISDERCFLLPGDGDVFVYGAGGRAENWGGMEVSGLFFHSKDDINWLRPLNSSTVVKDLLRETFCYTGDKGILERSVDNAVNLSYLLPSFSMGFVKGEDTLDFIAEVMSYGL